MVLKENIIVRVSLNNELESLRAIDFVMSQFEKTESISVKRYTCCIDHYYLISIHNPEFGLFISELNKHNVVFIISSLDNYHDALSIMNDKSFNEVNTFF